MRVETAENHAKKKISFYRERNEEHRALWLSAINSLTPRQRGKVFYLDEMGVDYRLHSLFARTLRGMPVVEGVEGARIGRANVVALLQHGQDNLTAPFCFEGSCDAGVINAYFETQVLADISLLPAGSIIVLDNAAFHKNQRTIDLVEKAGHTLLFLPPYSPDLNPIEKKWARVKSHLRKILPSRKNKFKAVCSGVAAFSA